MIKIKRRRFAVIFGILIIAVILFSPIGVQKAYAKESNNSEGEWCKFNGVYYYIDENSELANGWKYIKGKWYFFREDYTLVQGKMRLYKGKWYSLGSDGALESNVRRDGGYVDSNGVWSPEGPNNWNHIKNRLEGKLGAGYRQMGLCTGYVCWALKDVYKLPGFNYSNMTTGSVKRTLDGLGQQRVSYNNLKPGDVLVFTRPGGRAGHVGIVHSGRRMIHNSSSRGVRIQNIDHWMRYQTRGTYCTAFRIDN